MPNDDIRQVFIEYVESFGKEYQDREFLEQYIRDSYDLTPRGITMVTRSEALNAFEQLRAEAAGVPEMSLEEINEEIAAVRAERRARKAAAV